MTAHTSSSPVQAQQWRKSNLHEQRKASATTNRHCQQHVRPFGLGRSAGQADVSFIGDSPGSQHRKFGCRRRPHGPGLVYRLHQSVTTASLPLKRFDADPCWSNLYPRWQLLAVRVTQHNTARCCYIRCCKLLQDLRFCIVVRVSTEQRCIDSQHQSS